MRYQLIGNDFPAVEVYFDRAGESVFTQSGGMCWMSAGVQMETSTRGGIAKGIGRMFSGESMFLARYIALQPNTMVSFAATVPGKILPVDVGIGGGLICQKGAFLCAENSVQLNIAFTKRLSAGLFGGEGFILQDLSGQGMAFLEVDGDLIDRTLAPGEVLKVDTGNVVAFERTVRYEVETVKGFKNIFFGGEGLFLTNLIGPGRVILQTQNIFSLAARIAALIPSK